MAKTVKLCDMSAHIAALLLMELNRGKVNLVNDQYSGRVTEIRTTLEPKELIYPEGWYYSKGNFTNKHTSTIGTYDELLMINNYTNKVWDVSYCTLD